jgi:hypothetical protein
MKKEGVSASLYSSFSSRASFPTAAHPISKEQVMSFSKKSTPKDAASLSEGDYLLSLESELHQDPALIKSSALVQALVSRRVCLTDTQIIDSRALDHLFVDNESALTEEIRQVEDYRQPMFGTCTRNNLGANLLAALDSMLEPKPPYGFPAYFTCLTSEQNQSLREGYAQLQTTRKRREAFFKFAGKRAELSLQRAGEYFRHPQAVVARTQTSRLYDDVLEKLDALRAAGNHYRWNPTDHTIYEALIKEINDGRSVHSRERLHLAIYGGDLQRFRHFHRGEPEPTGETEEVAQTRLDWRYLVNTLYNFDLAGRYRSAPTFNTPWFELPPRLTLQEDQSSIDKRVEQEEFKIGTTVYRELLTIPFVASVRREASFWMNVTEMEAARYSGDEKKYMKVLKQHIQMVSELFKKHLKDSGQGVQVEEQTVRVMMGPSAWVSFGGALLIDAALGFCLGMSPSDVGAMILDQSTQAGKAYLQVTGFIGALKPTVESRKFKSFKADLARAARASLSSNA